MSEIESGECGSLPSMLINLNAYNLSIFHLLDFIERIKEFLSSPSIWSLTFRQESAYLFQHGKKKPDKSRGSTRVADWVWAKKDSKNADVILCKQNKYCQESALAIKKRFHFAKKELLQVIKGWFLWRRMFARRESGETRWSGVNFFISIIIFFKRRCLLLK